MTLEGNITGGGELQVDGAIKGDVRVERVTIGEGGHVDGGVYAEAVEVRGRVNGSITAKQVARICGEELRQRPIERPRPNEVGNDVENYVFRALPQVGLRCERPTSSSGIGKAAGYPDLLIYDEANRPTYLECKIFDLKSALTTFRSFYLSPSSEFKVCCDARHLLLSFQTLKRPINNSANSHYTASAFKLVDLHDLLCDMKYEFNADNRKLYAKSLILAEGAL
jgi:hypothetical protein